jgi:hypothetical protein
MGAVHSFLIRRLLGRLRIGPDVLRHLTAFQRLGEALDVAPPLEMAPVGLRTALRAFRTRGAVQIRPDWVWPYWVTRQLDPRLPSFIPRGHLPFLSNVTCRNWTMIGRPGSRWEAIVDPTGLVTPWFDGWSLDWWVRDGDGWRFPSHGENVQQRLLGSRPIVETTLYLEEGDVVHRTYVDVTGDGEELVVAELENRGAQPRDVAFALRPYNPEGLAVVESVVVDGPVVHVDGNAALFLPAAPARTLISTFRRGDTARLLSAEGGDPATGEVHGDPAGMAQAAFVYPLAPGQTVSTATPLAPPRTRRKQRVRRSSQPVRVTLHTAEAVARQWDGELRRGMQVELPDERLQEAVDVNRAYMLLFCDGDEITPGPHTYHRFWFRDAAYQLGALDRWGFHDEAARILESFPRRQRRDGFFYSQWREWDSNGAAIFAVAEHERLTGRRGLSAESLDAVRRGAAWIEAQCGERADTPVEARGLFPPGISAEHLGPYDFYYWDNFWGMRGLLDAAELLRAAGDDGAAHYDAAARRLHEAIVASLELVARRIGRRLIPAGPTRAVDAAMIGSLSACYPLRLLDCQDELISGTLERLRSDFCLGEAFFQGISHTGLGTYLTLQLAFVELERGERRSWKRLRWLLDAATPTYTWPEAIHPRLGGGCIGDGHHGWAAADFLSFVRNVLVREDAGGLALLTILPPEWEGQRIAVRDAPTHAGRISFELTWPGGRPVLEWHCEAPDVRLRAPGLDPTWSTTERSGRSALGEGAQRVPGTATAR